MTTLTPPPPERQPAQVHADAVHAERAGESAARRARGPGQGIYLCK